MPHGRDAELIAVIVIVAAAATAAADLKILEQAGRIQRPPGLEPLHFERVPAWAAQPAGGMVNATR